MPAEPYSLGIGVEVDQKQMTDVLGQLNTALGAFGTGVSKLNDMLVSSFTGAQASADQLANSLSGSLVLPAGGGMGGVPGDLIDQIIGDSPEDMGRIDAFKKSLDPLAPILDGLSTLTLALSGNMQKLNTTTDDMSLSLNTLVGMGGKEGVPVATEALTDLDAEIKEKPKDIGKLGKALGVLSGGFGYLVKGVGFGISALSGLAHVAKFVVTSALELVSFAVGKVVDGLHFAWEGVEAFAEGMRKGFEFTKQAEELEKATIHMAVGMGGGWKEADKLRDSILNLGIVSAESLTDITKLTGGLGNAGMTLTDFSSETQNALIDLSTMFHVSGESIAMTSKTLGSFGMDLGNTLGDAVAFQKGFKLPGVFEQLPAIVNFARDTFLSFSQSVVGSGADIVKATMHTAGVFAKAFGTTMADAVKRAEETIGRFAGAAQQDQDVFLGLSSSFSDLTMTLMQSGVPIQKSMDLVKLGTTDAVAAAEKYAEVLDRMPEGFMKKRFMSQLQKQLPKDVLALVKDSNLLKKTLTDRKLAQAFEKTIAGQGVGAFNEMTDTIQSATMEVRTLVNNLYDLAKATFGQIGKMLGFDEVLAGARDTLQGFNRRLKDFIGSDQFKKFMDKIKPVAVAVGKVLFGLGDSLMRVAHGVEILFNEWSAGGASLDPEEMFGRLTKWFKGNGLEKTLLPMTRKLQDFLLQHMPDMQKWAYEFGRLLGVGIGKIAKTVVNVFTDLFSDSGKKGIQGASGTWEEELSGTISGALKVVGGVIRTGLGAAATEIYNQFDTTFTRLAIGWEEVKHDTSVVWHTVADAVQDTFNAIGVFVNDLVIVPIRKKWVNFTSGLEESVAVIGGVFKGSLSGIKIAFFDNIKKMSDKFFDFIKGQLEGIQKVVSAINDWTGGLDGVVSKVGDAVNAVDGLKRSIDKGIDAKIESYDDAVAKEVKGIIKGRDTKLAAIDTENKAIANQANREQMEKAAAAEAEDKRHQKVMGQLAQQLGMQATARAQMETQERDARRFAKDALTDFETTVKGFNEVQARYNNPALTDAQNKAVRSSMEKTIAGLAQDVQTGKIDFRAAMEKLHGEEDAAYDAILSAGPVAAATPAVDPATVAARAGGAAAAPVQQGVNAAAMQQLLTNFRQEVKVANTVTLKGGDRVSRELVRGAQAENMNANGNN